MQINVKLVMHVGKLQMESTINIFRNSCWILILPVHCVEGLPIELNS